MMVGCSKENPFEGDGSEGQVLKTALDVSLSSDNIMVNKKVTRANEDVNVDDFTVSFIQQGNSIASKSFLYGEMPDVVTLQGGTYHVVATLGEDREAEWENPYYLGESKPFEVIPEEITSYVDPVVCALRNIKATIEFDPSLAAVMSSDSYVEVKVGDNNGLNYGIDEAKAGKAGYFRHTDETTLVATFHGTINGSEIVETKSYNGIDKGRWYKLTFRLHQYDGDDTGDGDVTVVVDASVDVDDVNGDVNIGDDEPLDDGERPTEGDDPNPDDPNPDDPAKDEGPQILAVSPGLVFDTPWNVDASTQCAFKITSSAEGGITALTCDIISDNLTPEELEGVGLNQHLDLVNTPANLAEGLTNLGFPINVGGQKVVNFDISGFMGLMSVFGPAQHKFQLYVKDANGECTKTLILQF